MKFEKENCFLLSIDIIKQDRYIDQREGGGRIIGSQQQR